MNMKFFVAPKPEASRFAADLLYQVITQSTIVNKMKVLLGTSTGTSPVEVYKALAEHNFRDVDPRRLTIFQQDVYWLKDKSLQGISGLDYKLEIEQAVIKSCFEEQGVIPPYFFIPDQWATSPETAIAAHRASFSMARREAALYVHLLGIGENGHIGFNEPGTQFNQPTHLVTLSEESIRQNAGYYFGGDMTKIPRQAITTGLYELGQMDIAIMVAFGPRKADALTRAFCKAPSEAVPASMLAANNIPTLVFCDGQAAVGLRKEHPECEICAFNTLQVAAKYISQCSVI